MRPKIRPMSVKDKPAVMQILRDTPEFKPAEVVVAEELLDCYLDAPSASGYHVLVAEVGSSVIGYTCYGPTPLTEGTWDIYWIAVAAKEQGQGVGQTLVTSAEKKIGETQARLVFIETSSKPEYEKARRFYHLQGYELICQIADFYTPGDDKIIFQKRLR